MREQPAADRVATLLLWFLREPLRYRTEMRRREAPPLDSEVVLKLALGHPVEFADPALCRVSSATLREAAAAYVRQVLFRPDATPYQTLGLARGASAQAIKENFRLLMQLVHPDRQDTEALWPEAFAAQANRAYGMLRNEDSRAKLDREEEARAARDRASQQKISAAVMTPATRWPASFVARRPPPGPVLPERLTAVVGGFLRHHPAVVAFVVLLSGAAMIVGAVVWEGQAGSLTREGRELSAPTTPAPTRIAAEVAFRAPGPGAPAALPAGGGAHMSAATPSHSLESDAVPAMHAVDAARAAAAEPGIVAKDTRETPHQPTTVRVVAAAGPVAHAANIGTAASVPATLLAAANPAAASTEAPPVRTEAATPAAAPAGTPAATAQPITMAEIEALSAAFVDSYDHGRADTFAALFDDDAETNLYHGRAAIRGEYGELFRLSEWRRMQLRQINWRRAGERAYAKGEIAVRIVWRDGREVEQRVAVDIELTRRDGRVVITRLAHQPSAP